MENKELVEKKLSELGFKLGCFDDRINTITIEELATTLSKLKQEYAMVDVYLTGERHILEVETEEDKKYFGVFTVEDFADKFIHTW